ncbi:MAG: hypothetical protein EPN47_09765 [Acidobacteria bacterium]|nr:MAG: hypothetical protein EPN47_09765 [Acidobacteriota bacterium]
MNSQHTPPNGSKTTSLVTARDIAAIVFRHRKVAISSFIVILVGAMFCLYRSGRYQSQMMILVENGKRANPVVTAQENATPEMRTQVTEQEMNSELALLESPSLLQQVVVSCGLDSRPGRFLGLHMGSPEEQKAARTAQAVRRLESDLDIQVVKMADVISVKYRSSDPQSAARVLHSLGELYLRSHAELHRPKGTVEFFQTQTAEYRKNLTEAEARLVRFTQDEGVVSAAVETDAALRQLDSFNAMQGETVAQIAQAHERVRALDAQMAKIAPRMTTQIKSSDKALLIEKLKETLLDLELKRTELLGKYEPTYRPVEDVEQQIAQTKAAIVEAERSQWQEVTSDRDPAFEQVREDLIKSQADLAGWQARETALGQMVRTYEARAQWLQKQGVVQQDLARNVKTAEDNYMLYLRKQQESSISEALDQRNILNVRIAEAPMVPVLPVHSSLWYILVSGLIALLAALGLAFAADYIDPTLRTPQEVESYLNVPVLLTLPRREDAKANGKSKANGKTNGKSHNGFELHVS